MTEKLSTQDVQERLGDILNRVALRHDEFIIEQKGKPLAAIITVEKLAQIERLARTQLLEALSTTQPGLSEREADALADEAKHGSRTSECR